MTRPTTENRYKVHSSYIWLGSLGAAVALLVALVISSGGSLVSLIAGGPEDALVGIISLGSVGLFMVLTCIALVVVRVFSYKHLYFTMTEDEFNLLSGILNKKRVHIPYARIQSVDQTSTLLQRIFGVCTVSIDTAGGASNKAVQIPYLTKQQAEWLRAELFDRKLHQEQASAATIAGAAYASTSTAPSSAAQDSAQSGNVLDVGKQVWDEVGGVFAGSYQDSTAVSYEYGLTNKELLLAGISNNTVFAAILVAIVGVIAEVGSFFVDENEVYDGISSAISTGAIISEGTGVIIAILLGAMLVIWVLGAIGSCINYGGFRARRRGPRIEVEHGLLQHTLQGVNIDRVQAVVIKQTFIRRLLGYCQLSLARIDARGDSADASQQQQNPQAQTGIIIHPFLKVSRVNEVLSGLVPEYEDVPQEVTPLSPKALRRGLIRRCIWQGGGFWCAISTALMQILIHIVGQASIHQEDTIVLLGIIDAVCLFLYLLAIVLFILDIIGTVLWARGSSFAYNERFMQVTNSGFARETMNFPRQKIQFGTVIENPLQRMAKTATIQARTAAGIGGTSITLIDVTHDAAYRWLAWVEPRHR